MGCGRQIPPSRAAGLAGSLRAAPFILRLPTSPNASRRLRAGPSYPFRPAAARPFRPLPPRRPTPSPLRPARPRGAATRVRSRPTPRRSHRTEPRRTKRLVASDARHEHARLRHAVSRAADDETVESREPILERGEQRVVVPDVEDAAAVVR